MAELFVALLHHPVLDKNGQIVTTAVTNMDIHDIARSSRTFGVRRFFVCTPVKALRALSEKIVEHWESGFGSTYNPNRKDALGLVEVVPDLDSVLVLIERRRGCRPVQVVTSARPGAGRTSFAALRRRMEEDSAPYLIVLGTGWGLAPEIMGHADFCLEPIRGTADYNHLSVRAAAAIILDRLCGSR